MTPARAPRWRTVAPAALVLAVLLAPPPEAPAAPAPMPAVAHVPGTTAPAPTRAVARAPGPTAVALTQAVAFVPGPAAGAIQESQAQAPQEPATHAEELLEEEEHGERAWWYWPSKWINFIALVALLYWVLVVPPPAIQEIFSFPGLRVVFAERAAAIIAARELAAEQKQEASKLLNESEQRLTKIEEEVAALVADARTDAERERQRALADGKVQAEKIHRVAQREIKHQTIAAQRQLRAFVADLAVNMAEKSLAEHLTADDQDRLIREYLAQLGQSLA